MLASKDLFDDDEPIDLSWPEGWKNQLFYIVKAPVLIPMYYTCLDVRREVIDLTFSVEKIRSFQPCLTPTLLV